MSAKISARILKLVAEGQTLEAAIDAVIGKGAYEKLVGDVYSALRSQEG
jgi:hypothetical protein